MEKPAIPCPTESQIRAYSVGDLSSDRLPFLERHVLDCGACREALAELDNQPDDLLTALKHSATAPAVGDSELPQAWLDLAQRAHAGGPLLQGESHQASDSQQLVIDPGKRYSRRLLDGPCRLGRFELSAELGVGSFGHVFRAYDTELDRLVAIKILRAGSMASDEEINRFRREARSAAQLHHAAIVELYETGRSEEDVYYLVTEYIEGQTLETAIRGESWEPAESAQLVLQIARALQYAHEQGVVHRDVKPSNILMDRDGRPHIMDFGLAKREAIDLTVTQDGDVLGTPSYMSPEQASGDTHAVDARTDVYSLGVILYELLTGERPFHGNHRMLLLQVLEDEPRPPRALCEGVPRDLETISLKAMSKSPSRRYASAEVLGDDLQRYLEGRPILARPVGTPERLWRWCKRNPAAVSLFLSTVLASLLGIFYVVRNSRRMVEQTALHSAKMQAEMLEEMNAFYSELVGQLDADKIELTHEYLARQDTMPLPATFTIDAGKRISKSQSGVQVRLFSDYPFPWRKDGGPRDDFERFALARLRGNPRQPVHQFATRDGKSVLRYAVARVMKSSCLECHNEHEQSPKRDWELGDVRGVLQIIRPIPPSQTRLQDGLLLLAGIASVSLVGCGAFLFLRDRKAKR